MHISLDAANRSIASQLCPKSMEGFVNPALLNSGCYNCCRKGLFHETAAATPHFMVDVTIPRKIIDQAGTMVKEGLDEIVRTLEEQGQLEVNDAQNGQASSMIEPMMIEISMIEPSRTEPSRTEPSMMVDDDDLYN